MSFMKSWKASPPNRPLRALRSALGEPALVPTKTPLRRGPDSLAALLRSCPHHNIRSVVDLTNTSRPRYNVPRGIHRVHLKVEGHGKVPPESTTQTFIKTVETLRRERGGTVLVHCTHGLNRTGYLCCRWLLAKGGVRSAGAAMRIFATVRGAGIAREVLCSALRGATASETERHQPPRGIPSECGVTLRCAQ